MNDLRVDHAAAAHDQRPAVGGAERDGTRSVHPGDSAMVGPHDPGTIDGVLMAWRTAERRLETLDGDGTERLLLQREIDELRQQHETLFSASKARAGSLADAPWADLAPNSEQDGTTEG